MKKVFLLSTLFVISVCVAIADQVQKRSFNSALFKTLPSLRVGCNQGVSAPYSGAVDGNIVVAGGCNFPTVPAAMGGEKKFYDTIYALNPSTDTQWHAIGNMTHASAYGVGLSVGDGMVLIGGTDGRQSLANAVALTIDKTGKAKQTPLPPLPLGLDNMAGAYGGGYIYVAGGQNNGTATNKAFRLKYPGGNKWESLPDFPGNTRLQPVATVQSGAVGPIFYLIGGYNQTATNNDGVAFDPLSNTWKTIAPITDGNKPVALVGATCVNSGASYIVCLGGTDKEIFDSALWRTSHPELNSPTLQQEYLSHPAEWYRFRTSMLTYNTITDTWATLDGDPSLATAGAGLIDIATDGGHQWIMVGGESKPGIRTDRVTGIKVNYDANFGWLNWTVLAAYLLAMLLLGWYFMHREKNSNDFFTGGGRIPWWAAGISIFATMLSAITYMSIPAKAYATDWKYYPMQIMILLVAFPVIKYYLPFFRRLNVTTAYAYLERRFSYGVRFMASALFIIFMVARMALVLFLPSLAMSAVTGIDIFVCILLMSVITIAYCTMGGMEAVVWGDVVQGIILVGGALLAAIYLVTQTGGGATGFFDIATANDKFVLFDWSFDYRTPTFWVIIVGGLANNLISYTSDQTVIQRYMTTNSERAASRSIITNGILSILVSIIFYTIGTGLYTFFKTHPASLDITMSKTDAIFPFFMMSQLPAGIAGLLIAALFAATMSTISSNINSISTAFTMDMYKKWRPTTSEKKTLSVARYSGIVAGVIGTLIAILMAIVNIQSLLDYFNTILGLLTGAIGGLFLMGIFFKRINALCSLVGFICGTAAVFYMNYFTQANFFLFGFVSMAVSVGAALLLSLIFPNKKTIDGLTWKTLDKQKK